MDAVENMSGGVAPGSVVRSTVNTLLRMINEGQWAVGTVLPPQRELAGLLEVSRATLREAVSMLLTTGEIAARDNGRGFVITDPDNRQEGPFWPFAAGYSLREVYQFRHVVESYAAQRAAMAHTQADLAALRDSFDSFRAAAAANDHASYAQADFEFHSRIMAMSANKLFVDMHRTFANVMLESQRLPALRPGNLWPAVKEHETILEAIERGDPDGADYFMRKHIDMGGSRAGLAPSELP